MNALALDPQCFAAGRKDIAPLGPAEYFFRQRRGSLDDMLATVEHDQQLLVPEGGDQARQRLVGADGDPKEGSERLRHEQGVRQRRQIDETDAILKGALETVGNCHRDGRLADPTRADDRDETVLRQLLGKPVDDFGAPEDTRQGNRQVGLASHCPGKGRGLLRLSQKHGADEAIAATGNVGDVAPAGVTIAERTAKGRHVHPETPSSTKVSGQTRSISSCLLRSSPGRSTRAVRISQARPPRRTALSPSSGGCRSEAAGMVRS